MLESIASFNIELGAMVGRMGGRVRWWDCSAVNDYTGLIRCSISRYFQLGLSENNLWS